jgi:hypothetical protein
MLSAEAREASKKWTTLSRSFAMWEGPESDLSSPKTPSRHHGFHRGKILVLEKKWA